MRDGNVARLRIDGGDLYQRIGAFLSLHALAPEPALYSFAHAVLTDPDGDLARAVGRITEDGVRLSRFDIETLGSRADATTGPVLAMPAPAAASASVAVPAPAPVPTAAGGATDTAEPTDTDRLVAQTQAQVDDFAVMMREMHDETRVFGRDLAESAAAIRHTPLGALDEIARITGGMIARIHDAETRLARATEETDALRAKLAEARDTARRDPLTGLPNRRAFDEAFVAREPGRAPWCLAVCDIDRFKCVNDRFGHAVGDRVLTAIGRTLQEACAGHLVSRHGGEEFAILIRGTDLAAATALIDAARAAVADKRFRNRDTGEALGEITISVGITAIQPEETAESAFARADRLLYTAKADGRDRVCAA